MEFDTEDSVLLLLLLLSQAKVKSTHSPMPKTWVRQYLFSKTVCLLLFSLWYYLLVSNNFIIIFYNHVYCKLIIEANIWKMSRYVIEMNFGNLIWIWQHDLLTTIVKIQTTIWLKMWWCGVKSWAKIWFYENLILPTK